MNRGEKLACRDSVAKLALVKQTWNQDILPFKTTQNSKWYAFLILNVLGNTKNIWRSKPSQLVDWLWVPNLMRENNIRAWVEVVGSVMKNHCRVQWNNPNPARNMMNPKQLRDAQYTTQYWGTKTIQKYCRVQRNSYRSVGNWGVYIHEAKLRQSDRLWYEAHKVLSVTCWKSLPWGNPVSTITLWGKVWQCRAEARGRISTTNGAFPLHTHCSITSSWPLLRSKSMSRAGHHAPAGQMSPRPGFNYHY